ncbi:MAG: FecR family protein [Runella sp.]
MKQRDFERLTQKYSDRTCTDEEAALLEKWVAAQFNATSVFENDNEAQSVEKRLWQRLQINADLYQRPMRFWDKTQLLWPWVSAAAVVLLLVGYGIYHLTQTNTKPIQGNEKANTLVASSQPLTLPDGSTVVLEPNARLVIDEYFGENSRTVFLTGEAFFDIKRNEKVPFLVYSGKLITQVLGTSFRIKPHNNGKHIEVSVSKGRVSVYADEASQQLNGVILTPNQRILFDTEQQTIRQGIVETPALVQPINTRTYFKFEESTLSQVVQSLHAAYGVEILVANPILNQCAFTGDLNGLGLYNQLDLVCGSINAQYEIRGTTIFIIGNGCQ